MILFDEKNLSPVRRRTLERMTSAALKLYQEQKFPSPEEITREAEYAKVTLKSYFSTHSEFVEYVVKRKRRWNHTYYCERGVAMILFPITNKEQTHENPPHARRMAHPF